MSEPGDPKHAMTAPGFDRRASELRGRIQGIQAELLASHTGSIPDGADGYGLSLFGEEVCCASPEFLFKSASGRELPEFQQLLLLYYFATADGSPMEDKWVSFADLPGGRMYARAFQGYSGDEVVKVFGEDLAGFRRACERAGGLAAEAGDAAYTFQALPRLAARFVYWLGDEDFPSSCKILFDSSATHYVPIDACAIIGSRLAHAIIKMSVTEPIQNNRESIS